MEDTLNLKDHHRKESLSKDYFKFKNNLAIKQKVMMEPTSDDLSSSIDSFKVGSALTKPIKIKLVQTKGKLRYGKLRPEQQ